MPNQARFALRGRCGTYCRPPKMSRDEACVDGWNRLKLTAPQAGATRKGRRTRNRTRTSHARACAQGGCLCAPQSGTPVAREPRRSCWVRQAGTTPACVEHMSAGGGRRQRRSIAVSTATTGLLARREDVVSDAVLLHRDHLADGLDLVQPRVLRRGRGEPRDNHEIPIVL